MKQRRRIVDYFEDFFESILTFWPTSVINSEYLRARCVDALHMCSDAIAISFPSSNFAKSGFEEGSASNFALFAISLYEHLHRSPRCPPSKIPPHRNPETLRPGARGFAGELALSDVVPNLPRPDTEPGVRCAELSHEGRTRIVQHPSSLRSVQMHAVLFPDVPSDRLETSVAAAQGCMQGAREAVTILGWAEGRRG